MKAQKTKKSSATSRFYRRWWFWLISGVLVLLMSLLVLTPYGIDYGIEHWLRSQGADQARVSNVDFNPFTRQLKLYGLEVTTADRRVLKIDQATLLFSWSPFLKRRLQATQMGITGLDLTIEELPEQRWRIGGITASLLSDQESEAFPWGYHLNQLQINNSQIQFLTRKASVALKINDLQLSRVISWRPEQIARLDFTGQINGSELGVKADIAPFAVKPKFSGKLKLNALDLAPLSRLAAPHLDVLEGRLNLDVALEGLQTSVADFRLAQKGRMSLEQVRIKNESAEISEDQLVWNGKLSVRQSESGKQQQLTAEGQIEGSRFDIALPSDDLQLKHGGLTWSGKIEARREADQLHIDFDRELTLNDILIETPDLAFTEKQAVWEGGLQMAIPLRSSAAQISSKGNLTGSGLELSFNRSKTTVQQNGLTWEGALDYKQNDSVTEIIIDSKTSLPKITVKSPQIDFSEEIFKWAGIVRVSMPQKPDALQVNADGQVEGGLLKIDMTPQNITFNNSEFLWRGTLGYDAMRAGSGMSADGRFSIENLQVNHGKRKLSLLELKQLVLAGIKMESLQRIHVSKIDIDTLDLLKPSESKKFQAEDVPLFSVSAAGFKDVVFSPSGDLGMDSAVFENAALYLHHTQTGRWVYISDLGNILAGDETGVPEAQSDPTDKPGAGGEAEMKKSGFRIDNLEFAGDSAVHFVDETVDPGYSIKLNFTQAVVSDLDSHQPEQPSPLKLAASVGKYSRLNLQGNIQPFTKRFSMDVTGNIEALELPPLSPYMVDSLGYDIVSGELDAGVDLKIILGILQGQSDFRVSRLKVKAAEKKPQAGQSTGLKMPLESTLRLLRDRKNNINLKVPISGDIADPQFSFSDAINQAVVKALSMASLSYLKYMLGPYGVAIGVAELAVKAVPGIRLKPVVFEPGTSDLNEDAAAYLQQVATIMKDRPDLKVAVCGLATEKDRSLFGAQGMKQEAASSALDDKLIQLAQQRAEAIEDYLVSQYEIKNNRIFICRPELDRDAQGQPRADLLV